MRLWKRVWFRSSIRQSNTKPHKHAQNMRMSDLRSTVSRALLLVLLLLLSALAAPAERKALPKPAPRDQQADRILVEKSKRKMTLYRGEKVLKTYYVALGTEPVGAKEKQGDHKTPEGNYVIDSRNPGSRFHLALHISYPNAADRARARKGRVNPGSAIMIHGIGKEYGWLGAMHRKADWTDGCIAVSNEEIEEIWSLVPNGTPIEIRP